MQGTPVQACGGDQFGPDRGDEPGPHQGSQRRFGVAHGFGAGVCLAGSGELGKVALGAVTPPLPDPVHRRPHPTQHIRRGDLDLVELSDESRDQLGLQLLTAVAERPAPRDAIGDRPQGRPLKAEVRRLLGYPHPTRVSAGVYAQQAIGISLDEVHRAKDADVRYMRNVFPLLDIGWTRRDCQAYLAAHGWGDTPRSACIGCPYRSSSSWAEMKATAPEEFEDAVAFDATIRHGHPAATRSGMPLRGTYYLHSSRQPLGDVDLGIDSGPEPEGCSPWACRGDSQEPTAPSGENP